MVGNHANGEAARHQLINVAEAYQTVFSEANAVSIVLLQTMRFSCIY